MNKKNKKILFVHQNFPAQYKHVAVALVEKGYDVHTLSINKFNHENMVNHSYEISGITTDNINQWAVEFETKMIRANAAANKAIKMKDGGFEPDLIIGHPGWGETFFLKEVWPNAKLISYVEFYYKTSGCDIDFDEDFLTNVLKKDFEKFLEFNKFKLTARNAAFTHSYSISDYLISPTNFQKNLLPDIIKPHVKVIHDGIDTDFLKPDNDVSISINGKKLTKANKVITYVSRALDPYRGFHILMKSLPKILENNPDAYIIIVGDPNKPGYGAKPADGKLFKEICYSPIESKIDTSRVFFVGWINYETFIKVIQLSTLHIYLTYPFVLSWSMLEAMSCGSLVLGSNTKPVTEIIKDNKNGLLVDFFDADELEKKVTNVLNNSNDFNHIRESARDTIIKNYDLKTVCLPAHLEIINKALK